MQTEHNTLPAEIEALCREPIVHNGQRAVTTEQLARFYETDAGNITDNLNRNQGRFIEGVHFVKLTGAGLSEFKRQTADSGLAHKFASHLILWLERGAARHAKLLQTDKAWEVFEALEDAYFEAARPRALAIPDFSDPAAAARAWASEYEARRFAEQTKAEIGSRREATAMNTASQAVKKAEKLEVELDRSKDYATIKRMSLIHHGQEFNWRLLKRTSIEMGIPAIDIFDANYGTVKAYHADVWREAYALSIEQIGVFA